MMTIQTITVAGYVVLAVAALTIELLARRPTSRLMPISVYASAAMRRPLGRWLVLVLWWWVGWHFFVR